MNRSGIVDIFLPSRSPTTLKALNWVHKKYSEKWETTCFTSITCQIHSSMARESSK